MLPPSLAIGGPARACVLPSILREARLPRKSKLASTTKMRSDRAGAAPREARLPQEASGSAENILRLR